MSSLVLLTGWINNNFFIRKGVKAMKTNFLKSGVAIFTIMIALCCIMISHVSYAANMPSDDNITFWVREALREDPRITSNISVNTYKGIVKLNGSVRNLAEKKYAELEASKIQGVMGTINELAVKPSFRFDADIFLEVWRRLFNSTFVKPKGLDVSLDDGVVTLSGKVESWAEFKEAELLASEVRGVRSVTNNITVEFPSKQSDQDIRNDVISSISRDVYLTGLPISVDVKEGVVTLTGSVGNAYQKKLAGDVILWVSNVKKVDNKLDVKWWKNEGVRKKISLPSDDKLKEDVRLELNEDERLDPLEINIDASSGHVTIRGSVPTYYQKTIAEQDTHNVVGVAWVTNLLLVNPAWREDAAIRDDVVFEIRTDYALSPDDIYVRVRDGVVTLSGNVNNFYEKSHAAAIASRILGVREVINTIKVNWSAKYSDASLIQRIKSRLYADWGTYWVADHINVTVQNGKAILTGNVNFWSERREAGRVASLTEGIRAVDNRLTVEGVDYPWEDWYYSYPDVYSYNYRGEPDYMFYY